LKRRYTEKSDAAEAPSPEPIARAESPPSTVPEPDPAPRPTTKPVAPVPAPAPPPIPPTPAEATAPEAEARGVVEVLGQFESARLISRDGQVHQPGAVPAGSYTFQAWLPNRGTLAEVGLGTVAAGARVTVRCDDEFGMCSVRSR
jgi:outer membrane biosynthesis protein TonB